MIPIKRIFATLCLFSALLVAAAPQAAEPSGSQAPTNVAPLVNINQASAEELAEALQGVGESRARAIVESRQVQGPFRSVEALSRVKGVGEATVERNRQRIRLD